MLQSVFSDLSDLYPSLIPLKSLTDIKIALKKKKKSDLANWAEEIATRIT